MGAYRVVNQGETSLEIHSSYKGISAQEEKSSRTAEGAAEQDSYTVRLCYI